MKAKAHRPFYILFDTQKKATVCFDYWAYDAVAKAHAALRVHETITIAKSRYSLDSESILAFLERYAVVEKKTII